MHNKQSDGRSEIVGLWLPLRFVRYNFNFSSNLRLCVPCPTLQISDRYIDSSRPRATHYTIDSVTCDSHFNLYDLFFPWRFTAQSVCTFLVLLWCISQPYFLSQLSTVVMLHDGTLCAVFTTVVLTLIPNIFISAWNTEANGPVLAYFYKQYWGMPLDMNKGRRGQGLLF